MSSLLGLLPPVQGPVLCGGVEHRVRWTAGELQLRDHEDPEGERVLAALTGEPTGCVAVLEAWHRCLGDLSLLPALTHLSDRVRRSLTRSDASGAELVDGLTTSLSSTIRQGRLAGLSRTGFFGVPKSYGGSGRGAREDLLLLLACSGGLVDRLAAQAATVWAEQAEAGKLDPSADPALRATVTSRVRLTLAGWAGAEAAAAAVELTGSQQDWGLWSTDGWSICVPLGWLARVWAPGLAVTAGRFVLDAVAGSDALVLRTVGVDGGQADLTIRSGPV